jgi:hypothetical protein
MHETRITEVIDLSEVETMPEVRPGAYPEAMPSADPFEAEMAEVEERVVTGYTLADAMREGCSSLEQSIGWGDGHATGCALTTAYTAAKARGYIAG